jgi:biotin transporter BioY
MARRIVEGWKADVGRALLTTALYLAACALGLSQSFGYGGGLAGMFPFLVAFLGGPWLAAWISNRVLPSGRRRAVVRLTVGMAAGLIAFVVYGATLDAVTTRWSPFDPKSRFLARYEFEFTIVPLAVFLFAGAVGGSRWKTRSQDDGQDFGRT